MSDSAFEPAIERAPDTLPADVEARVQCPNCCRLAPVVGRRMGLLFYECELCGTSGAAADPEAPENVQRTR